MNTYKEFINAHGITLDPRGVQIYVDWLLACENDTQARKIGEAMQAAIDNYMSGIILNNIGVATEHTTVINIAGGNEND